jgi:hypothetical protein
MDVTLPPAALMPLRPSRLGGPHGAVDCMFGNLKE